MPLDFRTRRDADVPAATDPVAFFSTDLPALLEHGRALLAPGTARLALRPLTVEVAGGEWSLVRDSAIRVLPGAVPDAEALVKPIGVVAGISDVPWHKDCSLGRHSYECCGLTLGISVAGADARSGQLRVVAGSHRLTPQLVRRAASRPFRKAPRAALTPHRQGSAAPHQASSSWS